MDYITEDNLTQRHPFFIHRENTFDKKDYNKIRKHRAVEILYISKGTAHIVLNYKLYNLKEGDIVFINSEVAHSLLIEDEKENEIFCMQFLPELIYDFGNNYFHMTYFFWLAVHISNHFLIYSTKPDDDPVLHINSAYKIYIEKKLGYEPAFISRILLICAWFFKHSQDSVFSSRTQISYTNTLLINNILSNVKRNYSSVTVTEITQKHSLSPGDLRTFRDITGYTLREYIQNYRISLAKHLLSSTDMPVTEIVYNIGYNDSSYFSKLFTKHTDYTPSDFRKKHQISEYLKKCKDGEAETFFTDTILDIQNNASSNDEPFFTPVFLSSYYDGYTSAKSRNSHDFCEIIYNDLGNCVVEFEDETRTLSPGDVIIITPQERYKITSQSEENYMLRIQFYPDVFNVGDYKPDFLEMLYTYVRNQYRFFSLTYENDTNIIQSFLDIYNEHLKFKASSELIVRAGIMNVVSWILSKQYECRPDLKREKDDKTTVLMRKVIDYVDTHYTENLTLEEVSDKFFVNYSYLSRKFKETTKQRFNSYINNKRLMKACFLLLATNYSISEIASMLGFCSRSRFAEKFTQFVDFSPTEYRRMCKEKLPTIKKHKVLRR